MNYGRPDLIPATNWRVQKNMRWTNLGQLIQTERKKITTQIEAGHLYEMVHLGSLPTSQPKRSVLFGLTRSSAYYLPAGLTTPVKMTNKGLPVSFKSTSRYTRWDTTTYNGHCWFINTQNSVQYTDGIEVMSIGGECPAGRYVEIFYDHLVIGAPVINGASHENRIAFSDLYNFDRFVAKTTNEAGSRDTTDYDTEGAMTSGLTGMKRLGNKLISYTDSCAYATDYVGLPHIFQTNPIREGVGNSFPHSLVTTKDAHFFISAPNREFYRLSAEGLEPIGKAIQDYFFPLIEASSTRAPFIWGYHDPFFNEIWWLLATNPDGSAEDWPKFEQAVVYNYDVKEWFIASVEDVHAFCQVQGLASRYNEVGAVPFNGLTNYAMSELGTFNTTTIHRVWGGRYGRVYEETNNLEAAVAVSVPILETGDFTYDTITDMKEHDVTALNAFGASVAVQVSVRQQLNEAVVYKEVGTWVPGQQFAFNYPGTSGAVYRFRFSPLDEGEAVETVVTEGSAGTTMQIFDIGFNGSVTALAVRSDNKIWVAGEFTTYRGSAAPGIARLNADGTLDTSFLSGSGFTTSASYSPPTQLECDDDGGVWCALSTPRLVEYWGTRSYTALRWQGVDKAPLIKLSSVGVLVYEETDCAIGGDTTLRFGGVQVSGTSVYFTYLRRGASTSNSWYSVLTKKIANVLSKRRIVVSDGGVTGGKILDLALQGSQVFWSVPRGLTGVPTDVLDESGTSLITTTNWGPAKDLGFFVVNTSLVLSYSWINGGTGLLGITNQILLGGRVERGGKNNAYVAYVPQSIPPTGSFVDGRFGKSFLYQHRGLYQMNLGAEDFSLPPAGPGGSVTFLKEYPQTFGTLWDAETINIGAGTSLKVTADMGAPGTGAHFHVVYGSVDLFGGIDLGGPNFDDEAHFERTVVLDGVSSSTVEVTVGGGLLSSYFILFGNTYSNVTLTFTWDTLLVGGQVAGVTEPNAWNLQPLNNTPQADCGFTVSSATADADATIWTTTPLTVYTNTKEEFVYIVGGLTKFKGQAVPNTDLFCVSSKGVMQPNFVLKLNNARLSSDGTQRAGKVFTAKPYMGKILFGGRFTSIGAIPAGCIGLVDFDTAAPTSLITTTDGTIAENVTTNTGVTGFEFYGYEQKLYAITAE